MRFFIFVYFFFCSSACFSDIKAIIFDCDGVLVDNGSAYYLEWQHALGQQGYELSSEEFWRFMNENALVGKPGADQVILKWGCELLGEECAETLLYDKQTYSKVLHANGFPPIESNVNFLRQLVKERDRLGLKIGLASSSTKESILFQLKLFGIENCFDVIVSGFDDLKEYYDPEGTNKPKPYVYLQAAKMLGVFPEECVAIEDSKTGVSSAIAAGCITVAIPNASTNQQDLSQADLKIPSLIGLDPEDFLCLVVNSTLYNF